MTNNKLLSVVGGRWSAVILLLLAFALRVHRIGEQRVWWDEGWSVWVARFSALDILRQTGNDVHPPLYFQLLHLWRVLSGDSEAGLRLLSAFLGVLTVAATYALGHSMGRGLLTARPAWLVGFLAALFLTVSRFAIAWSQEIRMYALATLLAVVVVWAARRYWAYGRGRDAAVYVLAVTAGLYTLYLFAPVWAAVNLAWLIALLPRRKGALPAGGLSPSLREGLGEGDEDPLPNPLPGGEGTEPLPGGEGARGGAVYWIGLQVVVLALFLPWVFYAAGGFLSTASATPIRLLDFLHIYWTVLTVGIPVDVAQFNRLTLPALGVFVVALVTLAGKVWLRQRTTNETDRATGRYMIPSPGYTAPLRDTILLLAILLLPAILVYLISLPRQNFYNPPFNPRYLVIFTPFYSILMAWGVVTLGRWVGSRRKKAIDYSSHSRATQFIIFALAAFIIAVALVGLWPYYPGRVLVDDYPSLVSTIDAFRQPGDAVVLYTDTDWPIFAYHHPQSWRGVPHLWTITPESAADILTPIWESHDAVWLVTTPYSAGGDTQRHIPAWLAERAATAREYSYKDMALTLYARTAERAAAADTPVNGPSPSRQLDIPFAPTGVITGYSQAARDFKSGDVIHLFLYADAPGGGEVTVGLLDGAGALWAETTVSLPDGAGTTRQQVDLLVPTDAPSGRYRFSVRDASGRPVPFGASTIRQRQSEVLTEADVTIANRLDVTFDGGVRLLGYDVAGTARPGEQLDLTLYWSAAGPLPQRYKVFTHLLGDTFNATGGNFLWGQSDAEPAANTRPTTGWRAGEVIPDAHAIPIAADAPPGAYRLEVGLYDPVSGARLPVLGPDGAPGADHVIVATVDVTP